MEISAAVLSAPKQEFNISKVNLDAELRPEEVLVKVVAVGLCHTDLAVKDAHLAFPLPGILGHEGAGIVEKIGSSVTKVKPGDHVVLAPASCGKCGYTPGNARPIGLRITNRLWCDFKCASS